MWSVLLCLPEGDPHLWPSFLKSLHHQLVDYGCHLSSQFLCQFSKLKQFNSPFKFIVGSWSSSTLATWCKEPTHWKRPWCWESLKAGEGEDRMTWLDGTIDSMDMSLSKLQDMVKDGKAWRAAGRGVTKSDSKATQSNWESNKQCHSSSLRFRAHWLFTNLHVKDQTVRHCC